MRAMTKKQVEAVMSRMAAIWPKKEPPTLDEQREWVDFLMPLDGNVSIRACLELRETQKWRPSMADFKSAYYLAAALADDEVKQLPGKTGEDESTADRNRELYGHIVEDWVYCWRCDMAIALEDQHVFDAMRGLMHPHCPRKGSAPLVPQAEKVVKDEYFRKHKISLVGK
jgi:hypothetical protein